MPLKKKEEGDLGGDNWNEERDIYIRQRNDAYSFKSLRPRPTRTRREARPAASSLKVQLRSRLGRSAFAN